MTEKWTESRKHSLYARQPFLFHPTLCSVQTYPIWKTDSEQTARERAGVEADTKLLTDQIKWGYCQPSPQHIRGLSKLCPPGQWRLARVPPEPQPRPGHGALSAVPASAQGWVGIVCLRAARNRDELDGAVQHIKLSLWNWEWAYEEGDWYLLYFSFSETLLVISHFSTSLVG